MLCIGSGRRLEERPTRSPGQGAHLRADASVHRQRADGRQGGNLCEGRPRHPRNEKPDERDQQGGHHVLRLCQQGKRGPGSDPKTPNHPATSAHIPPVHTYIVSISLFMSAHPFLSCQNNPYRPPVTNVCQATVSHYIDEDTIKSCFRMRDDECDDDVQMMDACGHIVRFCRRLRYLCVCVCGGRGCVVRSTSLSIWPSSSSSSMGKDIARHRTLNIMCVGHRVKVMG